MVSQRQRLARKRYKEGHPELFPKPEPTPPKDPNKKKNKNKSTLKRKKSEKEPGNPNKPFKRVIKKHPLRVPGMKPGESCFICKEKDHIAKNCPKKSEWEKHKICLLCRHRGHSLKNCPNKTDGSVDKKLCYNCGETDHSLAKCPLPIREGGAKFAHCFICNEQGHLSKDCPQNTQGIYPKGGSCKICGGVTHLARDCPNKGNKDSAQAYKEATGNEGRPTGRVTKFVSGDELEDDFMVKDTPTSSKKKKAELKDSHTTYSKDGNVKPKKQGPKVVNFFG